VAARRFAFVSPNFHPRTCGVGDHSMRLAEELRRRGIPAAVFSREPTAPHPEAPEVAVHGAAGARPLAVAHRLLPAILATRPTDVVVQYTPQMWDASRFGSAALPWLASRLRHTGARITLVAHEPYMGFPLHRPDLFAGSMLQRLQFAALLLSCHRSFVTTESRLPVIEPYTRALHLPAPGVLRVGTNALPVARRRPPGPPRIGVFSTAAVGKRFDLVLDAFGRVASARPDAELVLVGDLGAPEEPRVRAIHAAVRAHAAAARIRVTGKLPLHEVAQEIADLDVYLFPMNTGANTRSGTLPLALGSGLPVVALEGFETDRSLFRDGDNILLTRELEAPSFARLALRLLDEPALAARVGAGARALYDRELAWPRIADQLLEALA
jgi:glycosyltransferase involved in cell wall biosynthesis